MAVVNQEPTPLESDEPPVILFKRRGPAAKGNLRKRVRNNDDSSSSDEEVPRHNFKQKKSNAGAAATLVGAKSIEDEPSAITTAADGKTSTRIKSDDATKQSHWFDDDLKAAPGSEAAHDKLQVPYKGLTTTAPPKKSIGPTKAAPSNVRMTTMIDFSPDTCKDYKQTGYCGFGDNCKFLHDRSDYKQGWQLDREWETVTKGKKMEGTVVASVGAKRGEAANDEEDAVPEDIPFACIICKEPYKYPIVTRCGHYFCEKCALDRYKRDPNCAACGTGTNGIFNSAKKLARQIEKIRKGG